MCYKEKLIALLHDDPVRMDMVRLVRALALPDCWIAAGFVRDAVWDDLHGFPASRPIGDVDVVWFEAEHTQAQTERTIEQALCRQMPDTSWSVKNQARMHRRNGDAPYDSVADAMRYWPETATAVAVRLGDDGRIEVNAPFGLADLFQLKLRPGPSFCGAKKSVFEERVRQKTWLQRYPLLEYEPDMP
ncbi:nucleotidyltransferase family protein [Acetobacter senegalensis]|nr:nucleotidyltransferase family protein [Acetobacter senegalensis]